MTLLECISSCAEQGITISFKREGLQLSIRIVRSKQEINGAKTVTIVDNFLPLRDDHMTEKTMVSCIQYLKEKLK